MLSISSNLICPISLWLAGLWTYWCLSCFYGIVRIPAEPGVFYLIVRRLLWISLRILIWTLYKIDSLRRSHNVTWLLPLITVINIKLKNKYSLKTLRADGSKKNNSNVYNTGITYVYVKQWKLKSPFVSRVLENPNNWSKRDNRKRIVVSTCMILHVEDMGRAWRYSGQHGQVSGVSGRKWSGKDLHRLSWREAQSRAHIRADRSWQ